MVYLMRILIVGDSDVGKTSLLVRFNDHKFIENNKTTIGVDYKARSLAIGGEQVKLQIWDTAGQERFRSMTSAFYNKAHGVILSFDVNQPETFTSLKTWLADIRAYAPDGTIIYLSANKIDKCGGDESTWAVSRSEIEKLCADNGNMTYFCTSGKAGTNVTELFTALASQLLTERRDLLQQLNEDDGSIGGPRTSGKGSDGKKKNIVMESDNDAALLDSMGSSQSKDKKKKRGWGFC
jgi:small GTP-binding protein